MIRQFQNYIETEPWEESLRKADKLLTGFCYVAMALAVLYFGGGYLYAWLTGVF